MISFSVSLSIIVNIAIYKFSSRSVNWIIHLGRPFAFNIQSIDSRLINILFIHFGIIASDIATYPCFPFPRVMKYLSFPHRFFAPFTQNFPLCFAFPLIVLFYLQFNYRTIFSQKIAIHLRESVFTQNLYRFVNFDLDLLHRMRTMF